MAQTLTKSPKRVPKRFPTDRAPYGPRILILKPEKARTSEKVNPFVIVVYPDFRELIDSCYTLTRDLPDSQDRWTN